MLGWWKSNAVSIGPVVDALIAGTGKTVDNAGQYLGQRYKTLVEALRLQERLFQV
jgi:hypothetical protein